MTHIARRHLVFAAHLLLLAFVSLPAVVQAQESEAQPQPTPLTAPPPFKMIVKEEREALDVAAKDAQKRLKMTIEFADGHLSRAEQHTSRENYEAASTEVGMYHALL